MSPTTARAADNRRPGNVLRLVLAAVLWLPLLASAQIEALPAVAKPGTAIATFAGGCFWCMEPPFDKLDGVLSTTSGHTGGHVDHVTYKQVGQGNTGHTEAVRIVYNPRKVTYQKLLDVYWRQINPTTPGRQFCDVGSQYRPEIFVHNAEQRRLAEASRQVLEDSKRFDKPIRVRITDATAFWPAEDYHQDYYQKNPIRYGYYRRGCGRDRYLDAVWGAGNH